MSDKHFDRSSFFGPMTRHAPLLSILALLAACGDHLAPSAAVEESITLRPIDIPPIIETADSLYLLPMRILYVDSADVRAPHIAQGVNRAAFRWRRILWPTPFAPYLHTSTCYYVGDDWSQYEVPPDSIGGLTLVVSIFADSSGIAGRASECRGRGKRYNPETGTIPAGSIAFNELAEWVHNAYGEQQVTPLDAEDWYWVALHEIGHVLGIGTSDRWYNEVENVWHSDSIMVNPVFDTLCMRFDDDFCGWNVPYPFFSDSATLQAVRKTIAPDYEGKLIPLAKGFGEDASPTVPPAHWDHCIRSFHDETGARVSQDIMTLGGGLLHPDFRTEQNSPDVSMATLAALRGFRYDPTQADTTDWGTNPLRTQSVNVNTGKGVNYEFDYTSRLCLTPVRRQRPSSGSFVDSQAGLPAQGPYPILITDHLNQGRNE